LSWGMKKYIKKCLIKKCTKQCDDAVDQTVEEFCTSQSDLGIEEIETPLQAPFCECRQITNHFVTLLA